MAEEIQWKQTVKKTPTSSLHYKKLQSYQILRGILVFGHLKHCCVFPNPRFYPVLRPDFMILGKYMPTL